MRDRTRQGPPVPVAGLGRGAWARDALAALALGAAAGLGQLPFGLPWVTLAALAVLLAWGVPGRVGAAFGRGWLAGFGHFLLTLHWITQPFMVDAARDGWMAPFGLVFMAGGLALFWGAAFALAARLRGGPWLLVPLWAGAELLRAHVLTGFPWAMFGHVWIDTGLAQSARLWGAQGLTLLTLGAAAAMAAGLRRWRRPAGWALAALPPAALLAAALALDPGPAPAPDPAAPLIRIVQPNVAQADKTDPDAIPVYVDRLLRLTAEPGAPDLVVWPETALPWLLDQMPDVIALAAEAGQGAPVVTGVQRRAGDLYYNSLAVVGPDGTLGPLYDKHHLVPFGEYVPFGELAARLGIRGLAAAEGGGYAPGPGPGLIDLPGIGAAMPLICYEGIFPEEVNAAPARPRLLLLVTNDAWFGTFAGPYQHLALSRWRAIEQGLPMVRAANTGVSAMIDGRGRVLEALALGAAGRIDAALPPALPPTPYTRWGDWGAAFALGCVLAAWLAARAAGARRKAH